MFYAGMHTMNHQLQRGSQGMVHPTERTFSLTTCENLWSLSASARPHPAIERFNPSPTSLVNDYLAKELPPPPRGPAVPSTAQGKG